MSQPRNLILFRTHVYNEFVDETVRALKEDDRYDLLVMCDESRRPLAVTSDVAKYSLSIQAYRERGLFTTPDVMWRCGDYVAYLGAAEYPNAPVVWMIEHDVLLNFPRTPDFFVYLDDLARGIDFTAINLQVATPEWQWTRCIVPFVDNPRACLFPLTRFSRRAIELLAGKRLALSADFRARLKAGEDQKLVEQDWPNDEVFCASVTSDEGYNVADFNDFGKRVYDGNTFGVRVHSLALVRSKPADSLVYHPVNSGQEFYKRMKGRVATMLKRGRGAEEIAASLGGETVSALDLECGPDAGKHFLTEIGWECAVRDASELAVGRHFHLDGDLVQLASGGKNSFFFMGVSGDEITKELRAGRFHDKISLAIIKRYLSPGGVFVDVGAHIGNHLIYVANFLRPSKIIAVEPNPGLMPILKMNVALNRVEETCEVHWVEAACSNREGHQQLRFDPRDTGNGNTGRYGVETPTKLILGDSLFGEQKVDFIKIDTAGADLQALMGLRGTIERDRVPVLVNVHASQRAAFGDYVGGLGSHVAARYHVHWDCENWLLMPCG